MNWKIFRIANTTWREVLTAMKRKILLLTLALAAALLLAPRAMAAEGGAGQPSGPDWTVFSEDNPAAEPEGGQDSPDPEEPEAPPEDAPAPEPEPEDPMLTADQWARDGIASAIGKGFVPADLQNHYRNVITRQEFCRMAVSWLEYAMGSGIDDILAQRGVSRDPNAFRDTDDPDILAAFALGITDGTVSPTATEPGTFTPDGLFTRQEAATMLYRVCLVYGAQAGSLPGSDWTDLWQVADWARDGVNFCGAYGLMKGVSGGTPVFSPSGVYTRQESILVFDRTGPEVLTPLDLRSVSDPSMAGRRIPILMYHAIADVPTTSLTSLFVRPSELEAQLKYLSDNGYQTITFEDLDRISAFSKPILLTFDDGYKDNYEILFPLLKKYGLKATIFVITDTRWSKNFLAEANITEMSRSGLVSIQSHTKGHPALTALGRAALAAEMAESKAVITQLTGKAPVALCYPGGGVNATVKAVTGEHYRYGVLNTGGQFTCGEDLLMMKRVRINRGLSVDGFASLIK